MLYQNPAYLFREQYQVSRELASFFEEDSPALQRLSQEFARTLVSKSGGFLNTGGFLMRAFAQADRFVSEVEVAQAASGLCVCRR